MIDKIREFVNKVDGVLGERHKIIIKNKIDKALSEFDKLDVSYRKGNPDSDNYYAIEFWKTVD